MKRHIFITCLALCATLSAAAQEQFTEGNLTYAVQADGSLAVAGCAATQQMIIVPERVEHEGTTRTVTAVGARAFANNPTPAIGLPESVTTIGDGAFSGCNLLTYIRIPAAVTSIGAQAFYGCTALGHLNLPAGLQQLGDSCFNVCERVYTFGAASLPQLQSVPSFAFAGCRTIQTLPAMEALYSIGASAFENCNRLSALDLTHYHGSIGPLAFNGCASLGQLLLPADHPLYRVTAEGQAIVGRDEEFVTALPGLKELTLNYPATGENRAFDPSSYSALTRLELPCTWLSAERIILPVAMTEITLRMPTTCDLSYYSSNSLKVNVFDYVLEPYTKLLGKNSQFDLQAIDLPNSQLYVQEVLPRYAGQTLLREGADALVWGSDFNAQLQEAFPDYFTHKGLPSELPEYRGLFFDQYVAADRLTAYNHGGELLTCIDGTVRVTPEFDVNDYFNWYAHIDTVTPELHYPLGENTVVRRVETDASGAQLQQPCWLVESRYTDGSPEITIPLPLLPTVPYDIHLLLPKQHPLATEEESNKNKIRAQLTINQGEVKANGTTKLASLSYETYDLLYDGEQQDVLIAENLEVQGDYGNALTIRSQVKTSELKNGYSRTFPLIGIRLVPKRDIDWLPSGVEKPEQGVTILSNHDLLGRRLAVPARGVNIQRMSDGTTRKVILRR